MDHKEDIFLHDGFVYVLAPGRPENLTHQSVGDCWALLSWKEPSRPNGVIVGYYLYFEFPRGDKKITDNRIISESQPHMTYNLTGLGEYPGMSSRSQAMLGNMA